MSIVVLGSINTDLVIRSARLPQPGETVLGGRFYQAGGGKGANQAVAATRAGRSPVNFIAAVGDDALGRAALAALRLENLNLEQVKTIAGQPTGVALIMVDEAGQNCISVASGANALLTPADVAALPASLFESASVFLAALESPLATVAAALARAKSAGLTTILNPAPAMPAGDCSELLALTDIITPNEHEAAQLTGLRVSDINSAIAAAHRLQQLGPQSAVITLGRLGAVAVQGSEVDVIPALPVAAVDSTAAGDAFNGALAVALSEGKPLFAAAAWATIAAALAVTRPGAQPSLPTRAEIEAVS